MTAILRLLLQTKNDHFAVFKVLLNSGFCDPPSNEIFALVHQNGYEELCEVYTEESIPKELLPLFLSLKLRDASRDGQTEIARSLLTNKLQIQSDMEDEYYYAPLSYAAENGHDSIVSLLLKQPVININRTFNMRDRKNPGGSIHIGGATALIVAVYNGHRSIVQKLLKYENINIGLVATWRIGNEWGSSKQMTALEIAWEKGDNHIIRLLEEFSES